MSNRSKDNESDDESSEDDTSNFRWNSNDNSTVAEEDHNEDNNTAGIAGVDSEKDEKMVYDIEIGHKPMPKSCTEL